MLHQAYALWFFWKAHKIGTQAFWSLLWQHLAMQPWKGTPVPWLVLYKSVKRMRDSVYLSVVAIVPLWWGGIANGESMHVWWFFVCCCLLAKLFPTVCNPMDCNLPGSVHEISQAIILEWVAVSFSRGFSQPRDWTRVSCIDSGFFTTRETQWGNQEVINRFTN